MVEQRLNVYQLHVFFQQAGGVSMPKLVRRNYLFNVSFIDQLGSVVNLLNFVLVKNIGDSRNKNFDYTENVETKQELLMGKS